MKYSAAFVAPVTSKPNQNAYSVLFFFCKQAAWKQISNSYLTRQENRAHCWPATGLGASLFALLAQQAQWQLQGRPEPSLLLPGTEGLRETLANFIGEKREWSAKDRKPGRIREGGGILMITIFLVLSEGMFSSFSLPPKFIFETFLASPSQLKYESSFSVGSTLHQALC